MKDSFAPVLGQDGRIWKSGCNLFHGFNSIIFIYLGDMVTKVRQKFYSTLRRKAYLGG
jgi:hypothetical protein